MNRFSKGEFLCYCADSFIDFFEIDIGSWQKNLDSVSLIQFFFIDSVDNFLGEAWSSFANSVASIMGAIVLISAIFPWFLLPVGALCKSFFHFESEFLRLIEMIVACYFYYSLYYRASARELNVRQCDYFFSVWN